MIKKQMVLLLVLFSAVSEGMEQACILTSYDITQEIANIWEKQCGNQVPSDLNADDRMIIKKQIVNTISTRLMNHNGAIAHVWSAEKIAPVSLEEKVAAVEALQQDVVKEYQKAKKVLTSAEFGQELLSKMHYNDCIDSARMIQYARNANNETKVVSAIKELMSKKQSRYSSGPGRNQQLDAICWDYSLGEYAGNQMLFNANRNS